MLGRHMHSIVFHNSKHVMMLGKHQMPSEQGCACKQLLGMCHPHAAQPPAGTGPDSSSAVHPKPHQIPGLILWLRYCITVLSKLETARSGWKRAFNIRVNLHSVFPAFFFCFTPAWSSADAELVPLLLINLSYRPKMHKLLLKATSLSVCSGFADSKIILDCCFHCDFSCWWSVTGTFAIFFTSQNEE